MESGAWQCCVCKCFYVSLKDLISHVRGAHSREESIPCVVCSRPFRNTNTYYKHVRNEHNVEYFGTEIVIDSEESSDMTYVLQAILHLSMIMILMYQQQLIILKLNLMMQMESEVKTQLKLLQSI